MTKCSKLLLAPKIPSANIAFLKNKARFGGSFVSGGGLEIVTLICYNGFTFQQKQKEGYKSLQTESSSGTEVVADTPAIIDSADAPKPVEAENSAEALPDLVKRGQISLEQFSDAFAGILKIVAAQEAAKLAPSEATISGNIVPIEKVGIPIPADQMPAGSEAQAALNAAMMGAAAEAVSSAPATPGMSNLEAPATASPDLISEVPGPELVPAIGAAPTPPVL